MAPKKAPAKGGRRLRSGSVTEVTKTTTRVKKPRTTKSTTKPATITDGPASRTRRATSAQRETAAQTSTKDKVVVVEVGRRDCSVAPEEPEDVSEPEDFSEPADHTVIPSVEGAPQQSEEAEAISPRPEPEDVSEPENASEPEHASEPVDHNATPSVEDAPQQPEAEANSPSPELEDVPEPENASEPVDRVVIPSVEDAPQQREAETNSPGPDPEEPQRIVKTDRTPHISTPEQHSTYFKSLISVVASPLKALGNLLGSPSSTIKKRKAEDHDFPESPLQDSVNETPTRRAPKRVRQDQNQSQEMHAYTTPLNTYHFLSPIPEASSPATSQTPIRQPLPQTPVQEPLPQRSQTTIRRQSIRKTRWLQQQSARKSPQTQVKPTRDPVEDPFAAMRAAAREKRLHEEKLREEKLLQAEQERMQTASSSHDSAQVGEKRKKEGYGFDYDDDDDKDENTTILDTTMHDVTPAKDSDVLRDATPTQDNDSLYADIARAEELYRQLPPSAQDLYRGYMTDKEWLKKLQLKISLHGPDNQRMGSSSRFHRQTSLIASPRPMATPTPPSHRLTAEQQKQLDRYGVIPGTDTVGAIYGVPIDDDDDDSISDDQDSPTPNKSQDTIHNTTHPATAAPSTPAAARRARHEQYKPRQPSRLREETTAQESSESEGEIQPPTPPDEAPPMTHDELTFAMFKAFLAIPTTGGALKLSPEFMARAKHPAFNASAAALIDQLALPLSNLS